MGRFLHKPYLDKTSLTLPIEKGGTAGNTIQEAVENLDILTNDKIGIIGGTATLDHNAKVDVALLPDGIGSEVTIIGTLSVSAGYTTQFKISNYDSYITYTVTSLNGTISVTGDIVEYTAPNTTGIDTISINSRDIDLFIVDPKPERPSIVSPVDGSISNSNIEIVASNYQNKPEFTHSETDWELAIDDGFGVTMASSYNDTVNLTSWNVEYLSPLTTYFIRVRYRDNLGNESLWSEVVSFKTKGTYVQNSKILGNDGSTNDYFGTSCSMSDNGDTFIIGSPGNASSKGAVYVFTRQNNIWSQQAKLTGSNTVASDEFGISCSISGDGNTIIVGSNKDIAYVFVKVGSNWFEEKFITPDDITIGDGFGTSVSISTDGTIVVIGSPNNTNDTLVTGSAYIFTKQESQWYQTSKLIGLNRLDGMLFGNSVAISGDGSTVAVGAEGYDTSKGSVYIFKNATTYWLQQARLVFIEQVAGDLFGCSVSLSEDGNTLVIGAKGDSELETLAGAAYVYTRTGSTWSQQIKLKASDAATNDGYGNSVHISKDGKNILIGSSLDDNAKGANSGSTYMYSYVVNLWANKHTFTASDGSIDDNFGYSVSSNQDGSTIGICSNMDDNANGTDTGSGYIFDVVSTFYPENEIAKLNASDGAASDLFGYSVSMSGDGNTAIIGAYGEDNVNGTDEGAAYVFIRSGTTWTEQAKLISLSSLGGASFGYSVTISTDGNTVAIGAPDDGDSGPNSGAVYVFVRSGTTWTQQIKILPVDLAAGDKFGNSVAISGDGNILVIGSPNDDDTISGSGSVYVFTRVDVSWSQQQKLVASDPVSNGQFGFSVAISADGNTIITGCNYINSSTGAAYVFINNEGTWTEQQKLIGSDSLAGDQFGSSVAISSNGNTAVVGASNDDSGSVDTGSAYIFTRSEGVWSQVIKLLSSDLTVNSNFGISVDISANGNIVAIGARNVNGIGAVYIFTPINGVWLLRKKLVGSDSSSGDDFGVSVSISGDGSELLVGAYMEDPVAESNAGSAYVFY